MTPAKYLPSAVTAEPAALASFVVSEPGSEAVFEDDDDWLSPWLLAGSPSGSTTFSTHLY